MKELRFLLLVMAICLASGVKAQFYDSADDICFYVEEYFEVEDWYFKPFVGNVKTGKIKKKIPEENEAHVMVFNFNGKNAAELTGERGGGLGTSVYNIKYLLQKNPSCFEEKVETAIYDWKFDSSTSNGIVYKPAQRTSQIYSFSSNHETLRVLFYDSMSSVETYLKCWTFKRVDKSFFKVGRSRTPSGTMHE